LVREGFFLVGADASAAALEKCRQYLGSRRGHLLLAPTPLDRLPLLDESVDAAICVDVLGHLQEPLPVLRELGRVLRRGGALYGSVFHIDDGCRTGPRMRAGAGSREYWYHSSSSLNVEYYFRFYEETEARALFESSGLRLTSLTPHRWLEPPHVGYRDEPHEHESWFALLHKDA
jgi:SAM-dependent methyltransferase